MTQKIVASINARTSKTNNNPFWVVSFKDGTSALCWEEALIMGVNPGDTVEVAIETHSSGGKQTSKITSMSVIETTKADEDVEHQTAKPSTPPSEKKEKASPKKTKEDTKQEAKKEISLDKALEEWKAVTIKKVQQMKAPKGCSDAEFEVWKESAWKDVCELKPPQGYAEDIVTRLAEDVLRAWNSNIERQLDVRNNARIKQNLTLYNQGRSVPAEAVKPITGGRLKGMSNINTMWRIKKLTEMFGIVGEGWKLVTISEDKVEGTAGEVVVITKIHLFVKINGKWSEPIEGSGGAKFIARETGGLYTDDEAYKKAYSDAISSACKLIGIGADVYFAQDTNKYDVRRDEGYEEGNQAPKS